ncbi:MAG TPA: YitT family protein [Candidatus Gastranaerophilales bacterium]|nr:YitT family protein [Candidatus Gastranaerophilales bacterium]
MVKSSLILNIFKKLFFLSIGVVLVGIGLEQFLVPNNIIDGGVVGISIITSYLTKFPLGLFILLFNLPFLYFGYKHLGKNFLFSSIYSIALLAITVTIFHHLPKVTGDLLLSCIFGGLIIGIGLGIIFRNNGSLDGTEIVAMTLSKKIGFSVGEIIMFFNIFILGSAGLVFGWDKAMYSLIAYFIIFKTIDLVLEGFDESKSVIIVSEYPEEIATAIMNRLERGVTFIDGHGGYTGEYKKIVFCVITRLELAELKHIVSDIDPSAFIAIENVHEVTGGKVKKKRPLIKFS